MKQVVCIKWGDRYGATYVNRLYGMVSRNITPPFRFVVLTDDPRGLRPEIESAPIPDITAPMPKGVPGKWPKAALWSANLAGLTGPFLFMDLDVIILRSLDDFFEYGEEDDIILARNAAKPFHRLGQTSLFRAPVGKLTLLLQAFQQDPQKIGELYRYEQNYVTKNAPGGVRFWPRSWVRHFRIQCVPIFPLNLIFEPPKPKRAKVVIFPGKLNPPDAIAGRWDKKATYRTVRDHLAYVWAYRLGYQGLRRYVRPVTWVETAWRE